VRTTKKIFSTVSSLAFSTFTAALDAVDGDEWLSTGPGNR
jgi:hypothetical protein